MRTGIIFSSFDLLHAGHVTMLQACKEQCDWLVVGLQTDPTIDRPQKNKPVQTIFERWAQLQALKPVDEIIPYESEQDLLNILGILPLDKRFIVAGHGNFSGYGEYVGLVGAEEKAKLIGNATATFAPTNYIEPFGNVVIEAQTCGTPTITTDWGAFTETNINGLTGYRCRTFDEFCKAAEDVKSLDPKTIHERAINLYSVDNIRYEYDKYFRRLLTLWDKGWYQRF